MIGVIITLAFFGIILIIDAIAYSVDPEGFLGPINDDIYF